MKQNLEVRTLMFIMLFGSSLFAQAPPSTPPEAPAANSTKKVLTVPAGEALQLELKTPLNSKTARKGDRADFTTMNEILSGDLVAIPRGATVRATVTNSQRAGTFKKPQILLEFNEIVLPDGSPRPITAEVTRAAWSHPQGEPGKTGRVARSAGKDAAVGALGGVIFGGGTGAMEGGIAGAAVGTVAVLMKHGPDMDFPRGMPVEIELTKPLVVPVPAPPPTQAATGSGPLGASTENARPDVPSDEMPRMRRRESIPAPPQSATTENAPKDSAPVSANRTVLPAPTPAAPRLSSPGGETNAVGYKLKVNVELVVVDTTVRDRQGAIVDNLKQEDFHLF